MHFDQRTQRALRDAGLSTAEIQAVSEQVVEATEAAAADIEDFFASEARSASEATGEGNEPGATTTVYSDMDLAHSAGDVAEHTVDYIDLFTHAADLRGYLRFDSWGVPVEGGRVLSEDAVELTLGPTVDDRVKFAADPDSL